MTVADSNLRALLNSLTPADRKLLESALREGGQLSADVRAILRWLRRRLKRRARAGKRDRGCLQMLTNQAVLKLPKTTNSGREDGELSEIRHGKKGEPRCRKSAKSVYILIER